MECCVDRDLQPAWLWGALWLTLNTHTGLLHFLVLNCTPTPQEREHSLRSLHLLQPPWTGFIVGLGRGMVVSRSSTETHFPRRHHCKDSNTLFFFTVFNTDQERILCISVLLTKCEVKMIIYWILRFCGPWNEEKKRNKHQTSKNKQQLSKHLV